MIQSFADQGTQDIFDGIWSKKARQLCPAELLGRASRKLDDLDSATSLNQLRHMTGHRLEMLSGPWSGTYSIRVNRQYRICFQWTTKGPASVQLLDYHR